VLDEVGVGGGVGLGTQVVLVDVAQTAALKRRHAALDHLREVEVHRVRGQARGDRDIEIVQAAAAAGNGRERLDEPGQPRHHLEDHLRQPAAREHPTHDLAQIGQARRVGDRLKRRDVQLALIVDRDLGALIDPRGDLPVGGVEALVRVRRVARSGPRAARAPAGPAPWRSPMPRLRAAVRGGHASGRIGARRCRGA